MWDRFVDLVLLFVLYSFFGWLLETTYATISERKFVNRGFLSGPFCPIYGFGAVIIIQTSALLGHPLSKGPSMRFLALILFILLATILEYITGLLMEKIFRCKWWDYSDEFLNLHGRICIKYSLLWGILACILLAVIQPVVALNISLLPEAHKSVMVCLIIGYFVLDTIKSAMDVLNLKQAVFAYCKYPVEKAHEKIIKCEQIIKHKRFFLAFPQLSFLNVGKMNQEIRGFLHDNLERIKIQFKVKFKGREI